MAFVWWKGGRRPEDVKAAPECAVRAPALAPTPSSTEAAAPPPPLAGTGRDLLREAQALTWPAIRPHLAVFDLVAAQMRARPAGSVVVTGAHDVELWVRILGAVWPDARLTVVRVEDDESEAHVRLAVGGPFDLVVDASDVSAVDQARLFQRLFMHLGKGRSYLSRRLVPSEADDETPTANAVEPSVGAGGTTASMTRALRWPVDDALPNEHVPAVPGWSSDLWSLVTAAVAARTRDVREHPSLHPQAQDIAGLGSALIEVHVHSKILRAVNGVRFASKLREEEVDAVLEARPDLGERLERLDPVTWSPPIDYDTNRDVDPYVQTTFRVPALSLRRYDRPTCSRSQVVTRDGLLFPETFRQNWSERMRNIYVSEKGPRFGEVRRSLSGAQDLPGAWFHLDSEWPGHYGHLVTEQLSRLWAWDRVRDIEPDVKVLMTLQHDRDPQVLADFEIQILGAFGIEPEDVHVYSEHVVPERLYTATGMFSLPRWVHPDVISVWDRVGDAVAAEAAVASRPTRLFVSRRPSLKRACHNAHEVERLFIDRGFEVFHPEDHPLAEQVALFRAADVVAGFAGSGLFSLAFCPTPKRVVTIGSDSYTARNEFLISAARGHSLVSVQSRPDLPQPDGYWTTDAFVSGFTFNEEQEGRYLARVLDSLD